MEYLTTNEAAAALGMTRDGVRKLIIRGGVKAERAGRDWLIPSEEIQRLKTNPPPKGRPPKAKAEKPAKRPRKSK